MRALLILALVCGLTVAARADLVSDPKLVYREMKNQFDTGSARGWHYGDWVAYFSAVLNAGRAYALRRPDDANYWEVAGVAVDLATKLRYDPLSSRDASEWYVREAAAKMIAAGDAKHAAEARALVARLDQIEASPLALARAADDAANANALDFPGDLQARAAQVETAWKGWILTRDGAFRALAFERTAAGGFPLADLSARAAADLLAAARDAAESGTGYSPREIELARTLVKDQGQVRVLAGARPGAPPRNTVMKTQAPADEYFGKMRLSVYGIRNEIAKLNQWLDSGWSSQLAEEGESLADAIDDWQHEYPHDTALPDALLRGYKTLERINAEPATSAAQLMRRILIVEYTDSDQARELLAT